MAAPDRRRFCDRGLLLCEQPAACEGDRTTAVGARNESPSAGSLRRPRRRHHTRSEPVTALERVLLALALTTAAFAPAQARAADGVLVELHYKPVANAQIAIW